MTRKNTDSENLTTEPKTGELSFLHPSALTGPRAAALS